MKEKRKSENTFRILSELLKLPTDVTCGDTRVVMIGRSKVRVENYRGILVYEENVIKVQAMNLIVRVEGKQLQIRYYDQDEMEIVGRIELVIFD